MTYPPAYEVNLLCLISLRMQSILRPIYLLKFSEKIDKRQEITRGASNLDIDLIPYDNGNKHPITPTCLIFAQIG